MKEVSTQVLVSLKAQIPLLIFSPIRCNYQRDWKGLLIRRRLDQTWRWSSGLSGLGISVSPCSAIDKKIVKQGKRNQWYWPVGIRVDLLPRPFRTYENVLALAKSAGLVVPPAHFAKTCVIDDLPELLAAESVFSGIVVMHKPVEYRIGKGSDQSYMSGPQLLHLYTDGTGRYLRTVRPDSDGWRKLSDSAIFMFLGPKNKGLK